MKPEDILKLHVGANAKLIRNVEHLTLDKAAELCTIQKTALSRIESGTENVTVTTIFKLANGYKHPPEEFLRLNNSRPALNNFTGAIEGSVNGYQWSNPQPLLSNLINMLQKVAEAHHLKLTVNIEPLEEEEV